VTTTFAPSAANRLAVASPDAAGPAGHDRHLVLEFLVMTVSFEKFCTRGNILRD